MRRNRNRLLTYGTGATRRRRSAECLGSGHIFPQREAGDISWGDRQQSANASEFDRACLVRHQVSLTVDFLINNDAYSMCWSADVFFVTAAVTVIGRCQVTFLLRHIHLTCQTQLSTTLWDRRLRFFGHIARADSRMDHTRVLRSIISGLPRDWKRPPGRPRRTWLRTITQDLRPLNIGLVSAWKRAQDRERWKRTVETATLQDGACAWWWWQLVFK